MDGRELIDMGFPEGKAIGLALGAARTAAQNGDNPETIRAALQAVLGAPTAHTTDPVFGQVAGFLAGQSAPDAAYRLDSYAPYRIWGKAQIEQGALTQMEHAVRLPVSIRGALMPDAHQGYGLPIGGVLATHNSVIPYAVGVDIACRMRMTIFDIPPFFLEQKRDRFRKALESNTRFGTGEAWETRRDQGHRLETARHERIGQSLRRIRRAARSRGRAYGPRRP
jgi:tRNA-splicing ligase RtcB